MYDIQDLPITLSTNKGLAVLQERLAKTHDLLGCSDDNKSGTSVVWETDIMTVEYVIVESNVYLRPKGFRMDTYKLPLLEFMAFLIYDKTFEDIESNKE